MHTVYEDPVYEAGVEVAPVWQLVVYAGPDKKMYFDGILNLHNSPVTKYIKDKNKTIISTEDIEEELLYQQRSRLICIPFLIGSIKNPPGLLLL
jgi:hypothetical protein